MKKLINAGIIVCIFGFMLNVQANPQIQPVKVIPAKKIILPKLKPNLVVKDIGWSGEFCNLSHCYKVLRQFGINIATCAISVRVMNTGLRNASHVRVRLVYTNGHGVKVTRYQQVRFVAAGGFVKSVLVKFNNIGSYKIHRPFIATVDPQNSIAETNESDNTRLKTFHN